MFDDDEGESPLGDCPTCGGTGEFADGGECHDCGGTGDETRLPPRGREWCEVCGRGLNAEDMAMKNGMCVPCANE